MLVPLNSKGESKLKKKDKLSDAEKKYVHEDWPGHDKDLRIRRALAAKQQDAAARELGIQ